MLASSAVALSSLALTVSAVGLIGAGVIGASGWKRLWMGLAAATVIVAAAIAAGPASAGEAVATLATLGSALFGLSAMSVALWRAVRASLTTALLGAAIAVALTVGPFLLGPALNDLPADAARWLLFANPWVMTASAAGIDVLHLDWVYHLSPLAHRGVALPHWSAACATYAVFGLVCYGATRLFPQESMTR